MKLAKSRKIILLLIAVALSLFFAVCSLGVFSTKADDNITPVASNYFEGISADKMKIEDGVAKFTFSAEEITQDKKLSLKELSIDDMELEFAFGAGVSSLKLFLTYDSYYVNGNKNVTTGNFDTRITNEFSIDAAGVTAIKVVNNVVEVNGISKVADNYYRIRKVDKAIATVEIQPVLNTDATEGTFSISYVHQKAGNNGTKDDAFKQTFVLTEGKITPALPVVAISSPMFVKTETGYQMKAYSYMTGASNSYSLSYKVYSVLDNIGTSELYPKVEQDAGITLVTDTEGTAKDKLYFQTGTDGRTESFSIVYKDSESNEKVCASYDVKVLTVLDKDSADNTAPAFVNDAEAIEAFKAKLEKEYMAENPGPNESAYVPLGTEIEIPSLEDFVVDDRTPYEKLTTELVYGGNSKNTSTSLKFEIDTVGSYYFYIAFTDLEGKGMDVDKDFISLKDDGTVEEYGDYGDATKKGNFIFTFEIKEDAKIVIEAPSSQGSGYKGTKYTASKFDIKAANCKITYSLFYNANKEATLDTVDGWVEIKQTKDVEEGESANGYTYDELSDINYNGQYTFTPDKVGAYKIVCTATSKMSFRNETESTLIKIGEEAKVVKPASNWLANNVWSVVFLSVGTLCLIGIIILLFVKPKEKTDEEK